MKSGESICCLRFCTIKTLSSFEISNINLCLNTRTAIEFCAANNVTVQNHCDQRMHWKFSGFQIGELNENNEIIVCGCPVHLLCAGKISNNFFILCQMS